MNRRIWKQVIATILTICILMTGSYIPMLGKCSNIQIAQAATEKVWDGTVDTSWYTGDKESYDISTPEQLAGLAKLCDKAAHEDRFRGVTINLTADIVLNDVSNFKNWETKPPKNSWEPIGNEGGFISGYCPFAGVFNGNGHTITGMYVNKTTYGFFATQDRVGLFECICGAAITDVKFNKAYIASTGPAGVLAGVSESSYVTGIEVKNSKVISLDGSAGGIIGSCHQFVNTYLMSFLFLGALGIFVNPILYADDAAEEILGEKGTILSDCKVDKVTIDLRQMYGSNRAGGIVGSGRTGIVNSQVLDLTIKNPAEDCGIIVAANPKDNPDIYLKKNTYRSCEIISDSKRSFIDKKFAQNLLKKAKITVGAKKSNLKTTVKKINKKSKAIYLKCKTNSIGKLKYKVIRTPKKGKKYFKVSKTGKVTIKKKAPRGTYKIKVYVAENKKYEKAEKIISIKITK